MNIDTVIRKALVSLEAAPSPLGDRSRYVGSSDVGNCSRKVVLEKLAPTPIDTTSRLRQLRGHVAENLIEKLFALSGVGFIPQLELSHPDEPFMAHVDFLLTDNHATEPCTIVEVKSCNGLPAEPYPSWLDQLQWQMGLFRRTYPEKEVRGHVLAFDLNAGLYKAFGPYDPSPEIFAYLMDKGRIIMEAVQTGEEPLPCPGLLCGQCPHRDDCPAHELGQELPIEVAALAENYLLLNEEKNQAEKRMQPLKQNLLEFAGERYKGHSPCCTLSVSKIVPRTEDEPKAAKPRSSYLKLDIRRRAA